MRNPTQAAEILTDRLDIEHERTGGQVRIESMKDKANFLVKVYKRFRYTGISKISFVFLKQNFPSKQFQMVGMFQKVWIPKTTKAENILILLAGGTASTEQTTKSTFNSNEKVLLKFIKEQYNKKKGDKSL
eukprot:Pgem_evm1s16025